MSRVILLLAIATLCLVAASCTQNTTTPQIPGSPEFQRVMDPSPSASPLRQGDATMSNAAKKAEASQLIAADTGGTVNTGRYTVTIPAGALATDTMITVQVKENMGIVGCELLPHGITFATPVKLTISLTGTDYTGIGPVTIFWYDTAQKGWVDVGGTFELPTFELSTQLSHFSTYRAGRSGW